MDVNNPTGISLPNHRYDELDSLRGLAALTVAFHHFVMGMNPETAKIIHLTPLRILTRGHQSVILFFLLSGFVLSLPYLRNKGSNYSAFVVKRICRIYLPYLAALALAVGLNSHFYGLQTVFPDAWSTRPTIPNIEQHILFLGDYSWASLNIAFWSLIYEMRISLAFPAIAFLVIRFRSIWLIALSLVLSLLPGPLALLFSHTLRFGTTTLHESFVMTLHYTSFFIIGAVLARHRVVLSARLAKLNRSAVLALTLLALLAWITTIHWYRDSQTLFPLEQLQDWLTAIGAAFFLVGALAFRRFRDFLHAPAVHHLGQISYSLYLIHGSVLLTLLYLCHNQMTFYILPCYFLVILAVAEVFHRLIERPTMALGRGLGKALESRSQ